MPLGDALVGAAEEALGTLRAGARGLKLSLRPAEERQLEPLPRMGPPRTFQRDIPYAGTPERTPLFRATERPQVFDPQHAVEDARMHLESLFKAAPGLPADVGDRILSGRWRFEVGQRQADRDLTDRVLSVMAPEGTPRAVARERSGMLGDVMILSDELAMLQGKKDDARGLGGMTRAEVEGELGQVLDHAREQHPSVLAAYGQMRGWLDEVFQDMVENGYILPKYHRRSYTPRRIIAELQDLLSDEPPAAGGQPLSALYPRQPGVTAQRETNVVRLVRDYMGAYYRKRAVDQMMLGILRDPTLNLTHLYADPNVPLPPDLVWYTPGAHMPGETMVQRANMVDAALRGMEDELVGRATEERNLPEPHRGGFVLPRVLATQLEHFYTRPTGGGPAEVLYKTGTMWARFMTVYSPPNFAVNAPSDYLMALLGMPGEKSHWLGILRVSPRAIKSAVQGAVKGNEDEWYQAAVRQGLTSSTLVHFLGADREVPKMLAEYLDHPRTGLWGGMRRLGEWPFHQMENARQALEAFPRIAAMQEGLDRGLSMDDAGRLGREITLPYGYGSPEFTRYPIARFMAPFMSWAGMASRRIFQLATTSGSRTRTLTALGAPPMLLMWWNHRNQAFRDVETSIPEWDRKTLHLVMPDPANPDRPWRDKQGRPWVFRIRFLVPEAVMGTFGLGNIGGRVRRVATRRDTPRELAQSIATSAAQQAGQQIGLPASIYEATQGRSLFSGQPVSPGEALIRSTPLTRIASETSDVIRNRGLGQGAVHGALALAGIGRTATFYRGAHSLDADVVTAENQIQENLRRMRVAAERGEPVALGRARQRVERAVRELRRVQAARTRGQ